MGGKIFMTEMKIAFSALNLIPSAPHKQTTQQSNQQEQDTCIELFAKRQMAIKLSTRQPQTLIAGAYQHFKYEVTMGCTISAF